MNTNRAVSITLVASMLLCTLTNIIQVCNDAKGQHLPAEIIVFCEAELCAEDIEADPGASGMTIELCGTHHPGDLGTTRNSVKFSSGKSENGSLNTVEDDQHTSMAHSSASDPSSPLLGSAVNILNERGRHVAIGTKINPNTILTHNHQRYTLALYTTIDSERMPFPWIAAKTDPVGRQVEIYGKKAGQQTRLVTFDRQLAGAPARIASQRTIRSLKVGDQVDIVYWDDHKGLMTVGQFAISNIDNLRGGVISVADPEGILNIGDSGGGVFFHNELIGNTWSVVGGGHIALVPARINENDKAVTMVKQATSQIDSSRLFEGNGARLRFFVIFLKQIFG